MNDAALIMPPAPVRTREGLLPSELAILYKIAAMEAEAYLPKPNLADMWAWADAQDSRVRSSVVTVSLLNGVVDPAHARQLAVGRKTLDFLARSQDHEEEIVTLFRAKAYNKRVRA